MGTLYDEMIADLQIIEGDMLNQVFTWKGADYICIPNTANEHRDLGQGGFSITSDLVLSVRADQFTTTYPTEQETIIYLGKTYRIEKVGTIAMGAYIRIHCEAAYKGV